MTNVNKPSVSKLIGSVSNKSIGLIIAFRSPKTRATISAVVNVSTLKPGTRFAVITIAIALSIQLASMAIISSIVSTKSPADQVS